MSQNQTQKQHKEAHDVRKHRVPVQSFPFSGGSCILSTVVSTCDSFTQESSHIFASLHSESVAHVAYVAGLSIKYQHSSACNRAWLERASLSTMKLSSWSSKIQFFLIFYRVRSTYYLLVVVLLLGFFLEGLITVISS